MTDSRPAKTIGLLTPYTGGNLGDGAIQDAVIQNIKERLPGALIWGITLYPEDTEKRHNISAFPITGQSVRSYSAFSPVGPYAFLQHRREASVSSGFTHRIKKVRIVHLCVRVVRFLLTCVRRRFRMIFDEMRHVRKAYEMAKSLDLLIVSGGGQIDDYWGGPWGHPYVLFKWALAAKLTGTNFVVLSVGRGALDSRLSRFFVSHALRYASYRSYRDNTSKSLLGGEGMSFTRNDPVLPDLAFSYAGNKHKGASRREEGNIVVGVSPIAYLSRYGWPRIDSEAFGAYRTKLATFVAELMKRDYSVLFFSTDTPDRHVIEEIGHILQRDHSVNMENAILQPATLSVDDLFSQLARVDYVIASRLHGVLLSHLARRPVLALSYDRKVRTYMEDMGQTSYCLDIHSLDEGVLRDGFAALEANAEAIRFDIGKRITNYRDQLGVQYDKILGRI